ncbi:MAG: hypothetical protein CL816_07910 [Coxiellaceae bacterium]|nr:hypothetical protein [Coxiellaceae bacterium]
MNQPKKIINPYSKYITASKISLVVALLTLMIVIIAVLMTEYSLKHTQKLQLQLLQQSSTLSETNTSNQANIHQLIIKNKQLNKKLQSVSALIHQQNQLPQHHLIEQAQRQLHLAQLQLSTQINSSYSIDLLQDAKHSLLLLPQVEQQKPYLSSISRLIKQLSNAKDIDIESCLDTIQLLRSRILKLSFTPDRAVQSTASTRDSNKPLSTWETEKNDLNHWLHQLFTIRYHKIPIAPLKDNAQSVEYKQYLLLKLSEVEWSLFNNNPTLYKHSLETITKEIQSIIINPADKKVILEKISTLQNVTFGFPRKQVIQSIEAIITDLSKITFSSQPLQGSPATEVNAKQVEKKSTSIDRPAMNQSKRVEI